MSAEKTSDEGYKPLQSSASSPPQRKSQEFLGLPKPSGRRGGKGIVSKADKAAAAAAAAASQQAAEEEARRKEALLQGQIDGVGRQGSAGSGGSSDDEPEPEPEPTAEAKEEEEEGPKETLDEKVVKREAARKAHVKKLFAKIDTKGKGKIETHRLHEAFLELGMRFDKFEVNKMIAQFDADQSGTIDLEEFGSMIYELNRKRFRKVFNDFDVDGSGELDEEEVRQAFELLDFVFTDEQMKAMMLEFDDSGDGLIQFPEFCEMLDSTLIGEDQKEVRCVACSPPKNRILHQSNGG
jgi:calmodulin